MIATLAILIYYSISECTKLQTNMQSHGGGQQIMESTKTSKGIVDGFISMFTEKLITREDHDIWSYLIKVMPTNIDNLLKCSDFQVLMAKDAGLASDLVQFWRHHLEEIRKSSTCAAASVY
jgi:hypothetical protein